MSTERVLALAFVALVACGHKATPDVSNHGGGTSGAFDERQACTTDGDCAVVEIECCDHCNGGTVIGIHKDEAASVRQSYAGACDDVACTKMACEQPTAICAQGICGLRYEAGDQVPALPAP
jgi:hypothetical protein